MNNRIYKFRGKRIDNGKWIYGSLIIEEDPIADAFKYFIKPFNFLDGKLVIPETVGQYTEYNDKNRKEIYEGDIVRCNDEYYAVIIWKRDGFILDFLDNMGCIPSLQYNAERSDKIEVIGNIYENPELTVLLSDDA